MGDALRRLLDAPERVVVGLMSGTSLDGIDAAVARLAGTGRGLRVEPLGFVHHPYPDAFRAALHRNVEERTSDVRSLALLDAALARRLADTALAGIEAAGLTPEDVHLIGSHGHTAHHVPEPAEIGGDRVAATLQLGDPGTVAALTGIPTIGGFRTADVALGGQGAPLVPYFDWALFADAAETRALLNLGGIANVTVLPAGGDRDAVFAFDTGPANMVLDALAERLLGEPLDRDGAAAARGTPDEALLTELLEDPYFHRPPPKSTGRERFGTAYVEALLTHGLDPADLLATATALTARSVADALQRFAADARPDLLIASGGGVHNRELMRRLADAVGIPVQTTADHGLDPDQKEALCFAALAHEWAAGVPTSLPAVTGAARAARLGALALPPP